MKNNLMTNAFRSLGPTERFWLCVQKTTSCWIWIGSPGGAKGRDYGHIKISGKSFKAHRFAYELLRGPIPKGMVIDHLCRNRMCVNPEHMEIVTNKENILRGEGIAAKEARMTVCKNGHALTGENLYIAPKSGKRRCRQCNKVSAKAWRDYRPVAET
jgi:hypothetical protein